MKEPRICLRPECGRKVATRGLCNRCYAIALELVKQLKTSWLALESAGKALPIKRPWGPVNGSAGKAIREWILGVNDEAVDLRKQPGLEAVSVAPPKVVKPKAKSKSTPVIHQPQQVFPSTMNVAKELIPVAPNGPATPPSSLAKNQVQICADCNEALTGQFARTRGGQVLCVPCAQARAKALSTRTSATIE